MNDDQKADELARLAMVARGVKSAASNTAMYGGIGAAAGGLALGGLDYAVNRDKKKALQTGALGSVLGGLAGGGTGLLKDNSLENNTGGVGGEAINTLKLLNGNSDARVGNTTLGEVNPGSSPLITNRWYGLGAMGGGYGLNRINDWRARGGIRSLIKNPWGNFKNPLGRKLTTDITSQINDLRKQLTLTPKNIPSVIADLKMQYESMRAKIESDPNLLPSDRAAKLSELESTHASRIANLERDLSFNDGRQSHLHGLEDRKRSIHGNRWWGRALAIPGLIQAGRDVLDENTQLLPEQIKATPDERVFK